MFPPRLGTLQLHALARIPQVCPALLKGSHGQSARSRNNHLRLTGLQTASCLCIFTDCLCVTTKTRVCHFPIRLSFWAHILPLLQGVSPSDGRAIELRTKLPTNSLIQAAPRPVFGLTLPQVLLNFWNRLAS